MLGDLLNICWGLKHPGKEFCYLISLVWLWQYCLILSEGQRSYCEACTKELWHTAIQHRLLCSPAALIRLPSS